MNDVTREIYGSLLADINDRKIRPGDALPPEVRLARRFGTNRMNAHRALKMLADQELIFRQKRLGSFVKENVDYELVSRLIKNINRVVYVLYSSTPHWIHWNETSFAALESEISPAGYTVVYGTIPVGGGRDDHRLMLNDISESDASALVVFPDTEDSIFLKNNSDLLLDFQMPVYMLNRSGEPMPLDMVSFVSTDPFGDGVAVGTLLRRQKCRNLIMLNEDIGNKFWSVKRYEGLLLGLRRGNGDEVTAPPPNICGNETGFATVAAAIREARGEMVVVAVNNHYAAKFIDFARRDRLRAPADFRLIAFDDNPLYRAYNLTSMAIPVRQIGQLFGKLICDQSWLKEFRGKVSIKVNSELVFRETFHIEQP